MNLHAHARDLRFEMARACRTLMQSIISPVISTSLYFVVFGAAIGSRIPEVEAISYGAFIVPGLDHAVAAHAEHLERVLRHLLSEVHRHDLRAAVGADLVLPRSWSSYVGAAATKSIILGLIILATACAVRAAADRASALDDALPRADLRSRSACSASSSASGPTASRSCSSSRCWSSRRSRFSAAASTRSTCCRRSGRRYAVQSGGVSGQRLPLELLRHRRRERRREPRR